MKGVLVAGAAGFVGSHTLLALQAMPQVRPVALVRDPARLPPGYRGEVRRGDIRDADFVARALQGVDAVCMAAAWTAAWGHGDESRRHLLEPTLGFLDAAVRAGVGRIVYPSSVTAGVLEQRTAGDDAAAQRLWPHMANVLRIEGHMRALATPDRAMVVLRLGHFVGERYGLGLLPLLLPRLRTHLVPWVAKGRTTLPLIAGGDVGRAMALAAVRPDIQGYASIDVVGGERPSVREVLHFLRKAYGYPLPHFGVSFSTAYAFARVMEAVSALTPWEPFITRSIVLLLEESAPDNECARELLGYEPQVHWKDAVRAQLAQMRRDGVAGMPMAKAAPVPLATQGGQPG